MSLKAPRRVGTTHAHKLTSTAAASSRYIGHPGGDISQRVTGPTTCPVFIVVGSAGSNGRPHSGHRRLASPRSAYPHSQQEPSATPCSSETVIHPASRRQRYTSA